MLTQDKSDGYKAKDKTKLLLTTRIRLRQKVQSLLSKREEESITQKSQTTEWK